MNSVASRVIHDCVRSGVGALSSACGVALCHIELLEIEVRELKPVWIASGRVPISEGNWLCCDAGDGTVYPIIVCIGHDGQPYERERRKLMANLAARGDRFAMMPAYKGPEKEK